MTLLTDLVCSSIGCLKLTMSPTTTPLPFLYFLLNSSQSPVELIVGSMEMPSAWLRVKKYSQKMCKARTAPIA